MAKKADAAAKHQHSRTGDPGSGEFGQAEVLAVFGEVPET